MKETYLTITPMHDFFVVSYGANAQIMHRSAVKFAEMLTLLYERGVDLYLIDILLDGYEMRITFFNDTVVSKVKLTAHDTFEVTDYSDQIMDRVTRFNENGRI